MAHRLLYTKSTSVTGKALAKVLGIPAGLKGTEARSDKLIRWGSSVGVPKKPRDGVLNRKASVELASNKLRTLQALENEHVRTPRILLPNEVNRRAPFPLLARKSRGMGGKDIQIVMQLADVARVGQVDFFSSYVPTSREFRVHAFMGEVLKISEKVLTEEEKFKVPWIRNFANGYTFRQVQNLRGYLLVQVENAGKNAVDALGLDFGAVDVILGEDGEVYVLEVNTGPGLADNSLEVYASKFAEILEIPEENLNWPNDMGGADDPDRREDPDPQELDRML